MFELSKGLDSISQRASRHRSRSSHLSVGSAHSISGLKFPPPFRLGRFHRQTSRPSCLGGWAHPNSGQGEPDEVWVNCQKVLGAVYLEKYLQIDHHVLKTDSITKSN